MRPGTRPRTADPEPRGRGTRIGRLGCVTLLALILVSNGCGIGQSEARDADGWVEIRGQRVSIEIAETPRDQEKGLGGRDALAWGHGMYFPYERPAFYAFWMKGMRFSIDIVWLRGDRIIDLDVNVPFEEGTNGPTLRPAELADAVLEVPAGYAMAHGWQIGDKLELERFEPK